MVYGNGDVERLKSKLDDARRTIIALLPEHFQQPLMSYYECQTWADYDAWKRRVVDYVVDHAKVLNQGEWSFVSSRAYCPLCGAGSSDPLRDGFAYPEGLKRHLKGWGNALRCDVLEHAFGLARDSKREALEAARAQDAAAKDEVLAQRRAVEPLYDLGPGYQHPLLLDEGCYGEQARDPASLAWAIARVVSLGFADRTTGAARSIAQQFGEHVVYADVRSAGKIRFVVYPPAPPKRPRPASTWHSVEFDLPDAWRNNLSAKLETNVADAVKRLAKQKRR